MSTSSSTLVPSVIVVLLCLLAGCGPDKVSLPIAAAADGGGFTTFMPANGAPQVGALMVAGDSVKSHLILGSDSGAYYISTWFDLPVRLQGLSDSARIDSAWQTIAQRITGPQLADDRPAVPVQSLSRTGWFINDQGLRFGVLVRIVENRAIGLITTTKEATFTEPVRQRMERFLNSLALEG